MRSRTAKIEEKLKGKMCRKCGSAHLIPRFPGFRHNHVRCLDCGGLAKVR